MSEVTRYSAWRGLYMTACWIMMFIALYRWGIGLQQNLSTAQQQAAPTAPATYKPEICDDETLHDLRTAEPEIITIKLSEGCFHDHVKMPVTWVVYNIHRSEQNGDWAAVWCAGHPNPGEVRPYYEDMGNTFNNCHEQQEQFDDFRLQGKGTITFRPITTAPKKQIPIENEDPPEAAKLTPADPESGQPDDHTITVQQCYRSGSQFHCWGLATNLTDAPVTMTLRGGTSVDDEGNSFAFHRLFFPADGDGYFTGCCLKLIPNTPTKFLLEIPDDHLNVKSISLSINTSWEAGHLPSYTALIYKDIPVQ